jgi:hypothetical protein
MTSATRLHFQFVIFDEIIKRGANPLLDVLGNPLGYLFDGEPFSAWFVTTRTSFCKSMAVSILFGKHSRGRCGGRVSVEHLSDWPKVAYEDRTGPNVPGVTPDEDGPSSVAFPNDFVNASHEYYEAEKAHRLAEESYQSSN